MNIGEKINEIRKIRKMTLVELSEKSGVQQATLSRIENGRMTGTVDSHTRIAEALGVTLTELYGDLKLAQKEITFQKAGDFSNTFLYGDNGKAFILTKNSLRKKFLPVMLEISAGGIAPLEENPVDTEKFIYCLEGEIEITVEEQVFILEPGDTVYFNASLKHGIANKSNANAKCLIISSPPAL